jgi:hypothetical protein
VSFKFSLLDPQRKRPHRPKLIIRLIKMGRFRWTERVARRGSNRNANKMLEENLKREYIDVEWIVTQVLKALCTIV